MVTDTELERLRSKIGQVVQVREQPYLTELTRDAIRHWAEAIGDRNPLYLDESYARASLYGGIIAPPTILYAFSRLSIGYRGGLPGVHSMFGGSHWRWRRPMRLGDDPRAQVTFKDLIELPSRFAGRMFKQISHIDFVAEKGDVVAEAESWGMRTERQTAEKRKKYDYLGAKAYAKSELSEIAERYRNESVRGTVPLYWEDVKVGEKVPEIIRGPYTATIAVAFEQGWGGLFIRAHGYWFDYLDRHPNAGLLNDFGAPEPPEAVHWDATLARRVGVPNAYDYGPERISWLASMLTNWIGDAGFLAELYCEVRRFNLIGDLTHCNATVTDVEALDATKGAVRLEVKAFDQRGEETVVGWAVVHLPMRRSGDPATQS